MTQREILIQCEGIGKIFCRDLRKSLWYGLRDSAADVLGRTPRAAYLSQCDSVDASTLRPGEFWANHDINFDVARGECLGLIGRNGAGKTTLLKMLNGLIKPDCGQITMRGQVSAMIALGAGFNRVLTGRENIYINGSILGLSRRQISDRLEAIVDFAELPRAIDSPVRTYSSGMQVRLGFAAAVHLIEPDILLLDEVLAVGDIGFTVKCLNMMRQLASRTAIVFVTHSMQQLSKFCSHAMLMRNGTKEAISADFSAIIEQYHSSFPLVEAVSGSGDATVHRISISSPDDQQLEPAEHITIEHNTRAIIELDIETSQSCIVRVSLHSKNLIPLISSEVTEENGVPFQLAPGRSIVRADLGLIELNAGIYPLTIVVLNSSNIALTRVESAASITVANDHVDWGFISRKIPLLADDRD